jgi:parallel beta-helix repeat protein
LPPAARQQIGLAINQFQWFGVLINGSSNNVITGNFLGTNAAGTAPDANWVGVWLGTSNNTVGGTTAADRNIISGNTVDGVQISGATGGGNNVVIGNYIGLDVTGTADLGNVNQGVAIYNGSDNNTIGGTAPGAGNVISGNNGEGVRVIGAGTTGNVILGNRIGTNAAGTAAIGNGTDGINIQGGANGTTIGGSAAGAGNLISGNLQSGIEISSSDGTIVHGNTIGLNAAGTAALANGQDGVRLNTASAGWFGGSAAGEGNVISGNTGNGIHLVGNSDNNVIRGNRLGTNALGAGFGNTVNGIWVEGAALATTSPTTTNIGGVVAGEANTIAFNGGDGVRVSGNGTSAVQMSGNSIHSNGELGIDLVGGTEFASGWTQNDVADADAGPNTLQNYPALSQALIAGGNLYLSGSLDSTAGNYRIHIYASAALDASSHGEGERYVGFVDLAGHPGGNFIFNNRLATLAGALPTLSEDVSVTAMQFTGFPERNTSEFSVGILGTFATAYDGFGYGAGDLNGDNGGTGWSTAWTGVDAPTPDANVLAGSLSDPTGTLARSGSHIETNSGLVNGVAYRDLGFTLGADGTEAWMSFLIRSDQPIVPGDYGGVVIGGTGAFGVNGLFVGAAPTVHYLDLNGGGGYTPTASSTVVEDTTALLVVRMEFLAGNDRFTLYVNPTPGLVAPDSGAGFQAQKINLDLGTFSHLGVNFGQNNQYSFDEFRVGATFQDVTPVAAGNTVSGTISEDVNGDSQAGDFTGRNGVTVRLFQDANANNTPDAGDTFVTSTTTSGSGNYAFGGLADGTYFVVVDSKTVTPSAGGTAGAYWAEQTYGVAGAMNGAASFIGAAGSLYGGRNPNASDASTDAAASLATSDHVTRVVLAGANAIGVNSAFSFNVVVNVDGDTSDDDGGGTARHSQGTLDQFILNANNIVGANDMRFVPAVAANAGGGTWWQIGVTSLMPQITGADTRIDGTAWSLADGTVQLDTNAGFLGAGGNVGVDGIALGQVARPELEIADATGAGSSTLAYGLSVGANTVAIRDLAIWGFGTGAINNADIFVGNVTGTVIEGNVIGATPGASPTGAGAHSATRSTSSTAMAGRSVAT